MSGDAEISKVRLLFVKPKHIGDSLLSTPALTATRAAFPAAEIWVVVRHGCEGILAGCPAIDQLLTTAPAESAHRAPVAWLADLRLILRLRRQHFDYAFELGDNPRGRWLVWLSGARQRVATSVASRPDWLARQAITRFSDTNWLDRHRAEKDFLLVNEVLHLGQPVPPLAFDLQRTAAWAPAAALREFVVLHPGTRWLRKQWPIEQWIALGRWLQGRGLALVISSGPDADERELAGRLQTALGASVLNTDGRTSWAELAGLLVRARLLVGVDTAAMHLAAACQCPTVALFGPSVVHFWRPWRVAHRVVMPAAALAAQAAPDYLSRVANLSAETIPLADVQAACAELLAVPVAVPA